MDIEDVLPAGLPGWPVDEPLPSLPSWAIPLARLWRHDPPRLQGRLYLSGVLGGVKLFIFANPDRHAIDDPHYILCLAPRLPPRSEPENEA